VQRCLVFNAAPHKRVAISCLGGQGRERSQHGRAEVAAHSDLIARCPLPAFLFASALASLARERGCYGMWVLTGEDNPAAQAVYTRAGAPEQTR
jgi:hypothetical protein